jgi:hypothetical protein
MTLYQVMTLNIAQCHKMIGRRELGRFNSESLRHIAGTQHRFNATRSWTFQALNSWLLKMGPIGCPERSVRNYHSTMGNIPEERRSHLRDGGSLKLR